MNRIFIVGFILGAAGLLTVLVRYRNVNVTARPATTDGAALFRQACADCHGARGQGRRSGSPRLSGRSLPVETVKTVVQNGRGRMPARPDIRGEALENLAKYVSRLR